MYRNKISPYRTQWTTTYNTMGDVATTFTSAVVPRVLATSARLTFNTNSHDSELGVGLSYTPADVPITVKARWDTSRQWGLLASLRLVVGKLHLTATAGVTGADLSAPGYGGVLSIEI